MLHRTADFHGRFCALELYVSFFFDLHENPFEIGPDPGFLLPGEKQKEALDELK